MKRFFSLMTATIVATSIALTSCESPSKKEVVSKKDSLKLIKITEEAAA